MKKIYLVIVLFSLISAMAYTQDSVLTNKRGVPILPQAGDWSIGIDARPFFEIFKYDSDVNFNFITDQTIIFKRYCTNKRAHRGMLRVGFDSYQDDEYVIMDGQVVPDPTVTVTDERTYNNTIVSLGYGMEWRLGYGRLQAFYGPQLILSYESESESYVYGNSFSMTNPNPTTYNFGSNIPEEGKRVTYCEQGFNYSAFLRGFVGVEYFIAPKISVGGEFGWGVSFTSESEGKENVQSWDPSNGAVKDEIYKTGGSTYFGFDTDNFGGAIYFLFHFK